MICLDKLSKLPLVHLDYPVDESFLLDFFYSHQAETTYFFDERSKKNFPEWEILRCETEPFQKIFTDLNICGSPRFYLLKAHSRIPLHRDHNTLCSVNFLLDDPEPVPIQVEGEYYNYRQAILNTQSMHGVRNGNKDRLLFKVSIFNQSYAEALKNIRYKSLCNKI